jgi:outer membrane biosynthesis protein TonB
VAINKKALCVSVFRGTRLLREIYPEGHLTVGGGFGSDIVASIPGLPDGDFRLIERSGSGHYLRMPPGLDRSFEVRGVSWQALKKRGGVYRIPIPRDKECALTSGDLSLVLSYREHAHQPRPTYKVDRSIRRPLIEKDDYRFIAILGALSAVSIIIVILLGTVDIKPVDEDPIEALSKVSTRFAKLILKPPDKPVVKTPVETFPEEVEKPKKEEKPEEKKPEEKPEEQKETRVAEARPAMTPRREAVQAKVKTTGLLVIMSKKRTSAFAGGSESFKKAQSFMKNLGLQSAPGSVNSGQESFDDFAAGVVQRMEDEAAKEVALDVQAGKTKDASAIASEKKEVSLLEKEKKTRSRAGAPGVREEAEVYAIVRSYVGGLKFVYNTALRKDPTLKGKVTVKIVIGPQGKVTAVEKVTATLESDEVVDAIVQRIFRWKFPEIDGEQDFTIQYTFDFTPVG